MKTKTKLILRAGLALLAASISATWCLLAASNAQPIVDPAKGAGTYTPAVTPFMDIASAGPLTHVWLGNELSCQVQHVTDGTTHEFFPPSVVPGDCGTFIAMAGRCTRPILRTMEEPRQVISARTPCSRRSAKPLSRARAQQVIHLQSLPLRMWPRRAFGFSKPIRMSLDWSPTERI